ncbi:MAG TPA: efflux RND transporter periplasmic adaptor subunit [Candidatus Eisenbacteria bacterium]|jgi:multidrug efflux system membrane fusion protein
MRILPVPRNADRAPLGAIAFATLLLPVLGGTLGGCAGPEARRASRTPVTVALAESRTVPYELDASGIVEPVASADVTAQVGGLVTAIPFREGDDVRAGNVLVQLDSRAFETSVAQAAAVLARDRAQALSARLELERGEALARQQLLAAGELDGKRATAEALAATVLADSATLDRARLDLAYASVRAPISGRTGRLRVHVGDVVKPSDPANPVVTIHQLRPIRVRFSIPQSEIEAVREERRGNVHVLVASDANDTSWTEGRLAFVDNQVDPASGTLLLKGEFANADGSLWPGAFARVRLRLRQQDNATVVPASAVTSSQNGTFCYVVKADTTVEMRPVAVTRTWGGWAVLGAGVRPGETVVTDGQVRLSPGAHASIRTPQARGARGGAHAPAAGRP